MTIVLVHVQCTQRWFKMHGLMGKGRQQMCRLINEAACQFVLVCWLYNS